jgi:hypothetical protein
VDAEFSRLLLRVVIVGGTMITIATVTLLLAFRAFGKPVRANAYLVALIAFLFICCLLLLRISGVR